MEDGGPGKVGATLLARELRPAGEGLLRRPDGFLSLRRSRM